jgi:transcriptional regulator
MLVHPWDQGTSDDQWIEFVRAQGFGQLVAGGYDRLFPAIVPTQYAMVSPRDVVLHLARPNPVWDAIEANPTVVLSVAGDWAFIQSDWKAIGDEDPKRGVPTTYYAAVQLVCHATVFDDAETKAAILGAQLLECQPGIDTIDPEEHGALLHGIRGIGLRVHEVRSKFKFGGNVDSAHREHVADLLIQRGGDPAKALRHMRIGEPLQP